jgi:perosamine synthetase
MKTIPQMEPLIDKATRDAVSRYMKSGGFLTEYKECERFERLLAEFLGVKYVSVVPSGTAALYLALKASGIGEGDTVLVPDLTMAATANAVIMAGAEPVLVDVDINTECMDIDAIDDGLYDAMIYVDFNGRGGNIREVKAFCKEYGTIFIEDACQALGSKSGGKYLGTFGKYGCFSLGFHKIITTGQGGFIVSHNKKDYEAIERLKDHGRLAGGKDIHDEVGFNFKFTDLQAVVGIAQLKTIKQRIAKKRKLYEWYWGEKIKSGWVPWMIDLGYAPRDLAIEHLRDNNVIARPFYPPLHTQKPYNRTCSSFPNATVLSKMSLWLPSSLTLTKKQVQYIRSKI